MIFVQPFSDNFCDKFLFLSTYWPKTIYIERDKKDNVSMREKVVQKLPQNGCTNIISVGDNTITIKFMLVYGGV